MINVTIQPFGRSLMAMSIGVMKYHAVQNQKIIEGFNRSINELNQVKKEVDMWNDMSFDITTKLIDKRFKSSKEFVRSGGAGVDTFQFKKSITSEDRKLQYLTQKNMLKARTRFNSAVNQHNQKVLQHKINTSFKFLGTKNITR